MQRRIPREPTAPAGSQHGSHGEPVCDVVEPLRNLLESADRRDPTADDAEIERGDRQTGRRAGRQLPLPGQDRTATSGVEQATTVLSGVSSNPVVAATFFSVTSANRSVGEVSKTGTTTERTPASRLNRSIAASRRWYGTGLRLVFS